VKSVVFAISGRIQEKQVPELQGLLDGEVAPHDITFDLEEVRLVDRDAVSFLRSCEAQGIKLRNCPLYIREWIETGSDNSDEPQSRANVER
jgi:hypothetical protein